MMEIYYFGQLVLAIILGGVLGWQRENWGKAAGPRTYALVTAGATLFTILSLRAFGADISRVAAQIVTGVGFLGAGAIIHRESRVEGLTTAAGFWMAAAIGMSIGAGYYFLSILATIAMLLVLMLNDHKLRKEQEEKTDNSDKFFP